MDLKFNFVVDVIFGMSVGWVGGNDVFFPVHDKSWLLGYTKCILIFFFL